MSHFNSSFAELKLNIGHGWETRYDMSEVTQVTIQYIHSPHHGYPKVMFMVMNNQFTSLPFHVNQPYHSWNKAISNFDLETSRSRSWLWSKGKTIQSAQNLIDLFFFKFDLEKTQVKVMVEVKGQGCIVHPVSNWSTSFLFHINGTTHSWHMSNRLLDLEKTHLKCGNELKTKVTPDRGDLTHWDRVTRIWVSKIGHHWFR